MGANRYKSAYLSYYDNPGPDVNGNIPLTALGQQQRADAEAKAQQLWDWVSNGDDGPSDGDYNSWWAENVGSDPNAQMRVAHQMAILSSENGDEGSDGYVKWLGASGGRRFTAPMATLAQFAIKHGPGYGQNLGDIITAVAHVSSTMSNDDIDRAQAAWFNPMSAADKDAFYTLATARDPSFWPEVKGTRLEHGVWTTLAAERMARVSEFNEYNALG
jgi:hypothetical protein